MAEFFNIDKSIKSTMDGFSIPSTAANTARFAKRLKWYNFMQFKLSTFNIYNVILTASIITGSGVWVLNRSTSNAENTVPVKETEVIITDTLQLSADTLLYPDRIEEVVDKPATKPVKKAKSIPAVVKDTLVVTVTDTLIDKVNIVIKDTVKIKKKIIIER